MHAVVLDTNVVLDCWVFADAAALPLRDALMARRVEALRNAAIDTEIEGVLSRPEFALDATRRAAVVTQWHACSRLVEGSPSPARLTCRDPDDQKFLDLALAARARVLFTKDKALLQLATRARAFGLRIATPAGAASVRLVEDDAF